MTEQRKKEHEEAKRGMDVAEAWTKCERVRGFYFHVPLKEFGAGMRLAATNGAGDELLRSLGLSLARAVSADEARVEVLVDQWEQACSLIQGHAAAYAAVVGYKHGAQPSA